MLISEQSADGSVTQDLFFDQISIEKEGNFRFAEPFPEDLLGQHAGHLRIESGTVCGGNSCSEENRLKGKAGRQCRRKIFPSGQKAAGTLPAADAATYALTIVLFQI